MLIILVVGLSLVVGGIIFVLLPVAGQLVGEIKISKERQKLARIVGASLLSCGMITLLIALYEPSPGQEEIIPRQGEEEIIFFVEPETIPAGECAVLRWEVLPPTEALLDGEGVPPTGQKDVCPQESRDYELLVPERDQVRMVTLHVEPREAEIAIHTFGIDPDVIPVGACATLVWEVAAPEEWPVLVEGQDVPHAGEREVCPEATTTYLLQVEGPDGPWEQTVTLQVAEIAIHTFGIDPDGIPVGACATLVWEVLAPEEWPVLVEGQDVPHAGDREVCPEVTTTYLLEVLGPGGPWEQTVTLQVAEPPPGEPPPEEPPPEEPPPPPTPICTQSVDHQISSAWDRSRLGCPTSAARTVWATWQPFQRGYMFWRSDTRRCIVFFDDRTWTEFTDQWTEGAPIPSRGSPPPGLVAPIRGFGYIWGIHDDVAERIGWALDEEKGFCAKVQPFEQGFIFRSSTVTYCQDQLYNWATHPSFTTLLFSVWNYGTWKQQ